METFVVRLRQVDHSQTDSRLRGVVHHVGSGEEAAFEDFGQLEALLTDRLQRHNDAPRSENSTEPLDVSTTPP
jgi:hypothetical protein